MKIAKRKKKKLSVGKLSDKAAILLQRLVRLKASDDNGYCHCSTCDAVKRFDDGMQGGHFIPRGKSATKLLEENVHPQCDSCNMFGMRYGTAGNEYTLYMIDMYDRDFVDHLIALSKTVHKWVRADLDEMIIELRERIKVEEERIGLT